MQDDEMGTAISADASQEVKTHRHTDTLSGRWLAVCGPECLQLETNTI